MTLPPPGWYPDEHQASTVRYWDGARWTEQRAPMHAPPPVVQVNTYAPQKSMAVAYVLLILLGGLGIHRFYLGRTGSGLAQLILSVVGWGFSWAGVGFIALAIVWIWQIIDLFLVPGLVRLANGPVVQQWR